MPVVSFPAGVDSDSGDIVQPQIASTYGYRPPAPRGQRRQMSQHDSNSSLSIYTSYDVHLPQRHHYPLPPASHSFQHHAAAGPSSGTMFNYFTTQSHPDWIVPITQHIPPPPPQMPHKVWILDCKTCGMFLTNRGMKAVLLLRPNISLFSTDALPINCSVYTSNPDALRPPMSSRPASTIPARTCECLTQSLCCHGCGAGVGYMIVIPCSRCTSSTTASNRATNGHRFVFHSNEIVSTERHYIQDEPGVVPFDAPLPSFPTGSQMSVFYQTSGPQYYPQPLTTSPLPSSPPPLIDYLPIPPVEVPPLSPASPPQADSSPFFSEVYPLRSPPPHPSPLPRGMPVDSKDVPAVRRLAPGDVVFWHHLMRNGEIPPVEEDSRARYKKTAPVLCGR